MPRAAVNAATLLAAFVLVTAGCGEAVYSTRDDLAAEAGPATLTPEQLAEWIRRVPGGRPTQLDAGFVALAWVDYRLLAEAAARGLDLADSATAALALAPELAARPLRHWHDTLRSRLPRVPPDAPDSLYAGPAVRVFQQILLPVRDQSDVRAISAVRVTADSLLARIRAGADFAALARTYSGDPSARSGGLLPPLRRGVLLPELERGSWRLEPGAVAGVVSRAGFHIVRRPALEEVREQLRVYAESLAARRADSTYADSLVRARGLTLAADAAPRVRAFLDHPSARATDSAPLASWQGGALGLAEASFWIDLMSPRAYMALRGTSDLILERFIRELAERRILVEEAGRHGPGVTGAEWNVMVAEYRRALIASLGLLGADSSGRIPPESADERAAALVGRLTSDSAGWRPLPSGLGPVLRARLGYRLHERGLARAARLAAPPDSGTSR